MLMQPQSLDDLSAQQLRDMTGRLLAERLQFTDPITGQARDFVSQFTLDFPDPLSFS